MGILYKMPKVVDLGQEKCDKYKHIKNLKTIIRYSFFILLVLFITIIAINAYVKNSAKDRIISADEASGLNNIEI